MKTWIADTSALVAYLDGADGSHGKVEASLSPFSGDLVTTSAVITETMYFLHQVEGGPELLGEFSVASGLRVFDLCQPPEMRAAAALMRKYADTPMDFADATLVLLAEALGVRDVLTLDRRGFSAFRDRRKRPFRLVLDW